MTGKEFRALLPERLRATLPAEWQGFEHRTRFSLVQLWYGDPAFHFEVWPQSRHGIVEVGLHMEHRDGQRNATLHRFFDAHFVQIRAELGECWLERWDRGWHKLYATLPWKGYGEPLLETVCERLGQQIVVLQPLLGEALARTDLPAARR